MYVALAGICIHFLLKRKGRGRGQWILLFYTVAMLLVSIVYFVSACMWSEVEFVEGVASPAEYATLLSSSVLSVTKNSTTVINIFLADSLILYRAWIIWGRKYLWLLFPFVTYLASIVTGIGLLAYSAKPAATFGQHSVTAFGTAFWSISVFLNVYTTALIASRLLYHRREMEKLGGPSRSQFVSVIAVLVESAALYSFAGLVYIPLFAINSPYQYAFSALLCDATLIAPTLIALRMALGQAIKDGYAHSETHGFSSSDTAVPSRPSGQRDRTWTGAKDEYNVEARNDIVINITRDEYPPDPSDGYHRRPRHVS